MQASIFLTPCLHRVVSPLPHCNFRKGQSMSGFFPLLLFFHRAQGLSCRRYSISVVVKEWVINSLKNWGRGTRGNINMWEKYVGRQRVIKEHIAIRSLKYLYRMKTTWRRVIRSENRGFEDPLKAKQKQYCFIAEALVKYWKIST